MGEDNKFSQKEFFSGENTHSRHTDRNSIDVSYRCTRILSNGTRLEIQKATKSDFGLVMSVGQVYRGRDYLPSLYQSLLDSGDAHMFLAYIDGNPVGFLAVLLIENGTHAVHMALRCKEGFRNQGIATQLGHVAELYLKQTEPKCVRQLRVTSSPHQLESSKYGPASAIWENTYQKYTPVRLNQLLHHMATEATHTHSVSPLTTPETLQLLETNAIEGISGYNKWFPMSHSYIPYRVSDPALRTILDNSLILCSGVLRNEPPNQACVTSDQITSPTALSFSSVLDVPCGVLFDVYYYGDCSLDSIKSHLRHIIEKLMKTSEYITNAKDVALVINLPLSVNRESIDNMLGNYCFEKAWECPHVVDSPLTNI